jgi:hypothetical protein
MFINGTHNNGDNNIILTNVGPHTKKHNIQTLKEKKSKGGYLNQDWFNE